MVTDARAVGAWAIGQVLTGKSLNRVLPEALERVDPTERGFLQQLCYGTLRHIPRLEGLLTQLLDKPLRDKDADVQGLLLLGLYQLEAMRVPDHAAVDSTVNATRALKKPWARGVTNAVLRRYLREKETLDAALDDAAKNSHPAWLYGKVRKQWPEQAAGIFDANNQQPPMTLRCNSLRTSRNAYLKQLSEADIAASPGELSLYSFTLAQPVDVDALPGFGEGQVSVQDEAAQLAALLLGAQPQERVLDACAAPGGKSCHILELQPQLTQLVCMDVDAQRLNKVKENLSRLGLKAATLVQDAATINHETSWPNPGGSDPDGAKPNDFKPNDFKTASQSLFDRILVDAPCSATGVIRRHPDIKVLRQPEDIATFAQQQLDILRGVWPLLKSGGTLLYCTCSILKEENGRVIEQFLQSTDDAQIEEIDEQWGEAVENGRQLLPRIDSSDGLFYSRLRRTN